MNSNREKITNIVMVGVFAAVLAVLSQISFPLPSGIPVTLQTFAVALCGYALGCKRGTLAVLVYIVLGAVGLPVFANFSGGFGSLVGLAGGYIYGTGKLAAHLMGETVAKMTGVEFIPVIITNIYGVGEKSARMIYTAIRKLIHKEHCSFTAGYQTYDFIYITDAINAIIAVAEKGKPFNRYYIGSGEPKPLREFLLEMRDLVDPTAEIGLGDLPFKGVNVSYDQFDLKKVERDTGYVNQIPFAQGIKMTADYIREEA